MRGIPKNLYNEISANPDWEYCWRRFALHDHQCQGRITTEHAIIYEGRQVNEWWAIIRICAYAHGVDQFQEVNILDKKINEWIAFSRLFSLGEQDLNAMLRRYPGNDWFDRFRYLHSKYGDYTLSTRKHEDPPYFDIL